MAEITVYESLDEKALKRRRSDAIERIHLHLLAAWGHYTFWDARQSVTAADIPQARHLLAANAGNASVVGDKGCPIPGFDQRGLGLKGIFGPEDKSREEERVLRLRELRRQGRNLPAQSQAWILAWNIAEKIYEARLRSDGEAEAIWNDNLAPPTIKVVELPAKRKFPFWKVVLGSVLLGIVCMGIALTGVSDSGGLEADWAIGFWVAGLFLVGVPVGGLFIVFWFTVLFLD